jgi:hypothetical protein
MTEISAKHPEQPRSHMLANEKIDKLLNRLSLPSQSKKLLGSIYMSLF